MRRELDESSGEGGAERIPKVGTALLTIEPVPGTGAESMTSRRRVPVAAPTARPCTIRAATSPPGPSATVNRNVPSASRTSAVEATGRRPTRSESEPTVSNETSSAKT